MSQRRRRRGGRRGIVASAAVVAVLALIVLSLGKTLNNGGQPIAEGASPSTPSKQDPPMPQGESPLHMGRATPTTLVIPAIDVHEPLMKLGDQKGKHLVRLPPVRRVGWYDRTVTPGETGVSVIVGYIRRSPARPGVFDHLAELKPMDTIRIARADGSVAVFRVSQIETYKQGTMPTSKVYGDVSRSELRIITCGGKLHQGDPRGNVVVFASLVDARHLRRAAAD